MKYTCNLIFDPDELIVGIDLQVEVKKFVATKVREALICARGDTEKAGKLLRINTAKVNRICRNWNIDCGAIKSETKIPVTISYVYGVVK